MNLNKKSKIFIAGHKGMVGSSIVRHFKKNGYKNLFLKEKKSLDLLNQKKNIFLLKEDKARFCNNCCSKSWRNCCE